MIEYSIFITSILFILQTSIAFIYLYELLLVCEIQRSAQCLIDRVKCIS